MRARRRSLAAVIAVMAVNGIGFAARGQAEAPGGHPGPPAAPPPFEVRGTLPWHNFLSGPSTWNENDYRAYLDGLAARKLNFVGFHCYTGGAERYAPYVEPTIRLAYRDVVPEAGYDTSLTARWGYRPLAVRDFAFGTGKLFPVPRGGMAFGADGAVTARSKDERYRNAHALMKRVIRMAHERGIQVAVGFEFGIHPPEFASIVPPDSRIAGAMLPDPTHPANIMILRSALDDILTEYPDVDWVWLWLHEHTMFVGQPTLSGRFAEAYRRDGRFFTDGANERDAFTGVWSLVQIRQVYEYLTQRSPRTRVVIGGWGGGPQLPPVLRGLDRALPRDIVFSCLNPGMGAQGHVKELDEIAKNRPVWSMPWLEGDNSLWHLQLRASSILDQVRQASAAGFAGAVAIHWRTEETRANLDAFSLAVGDPGGAPSAEAFYRRHAADWYGEAAADALAPILLRLDREGALGSLASPEYFPYDPSWGRMSEALADRLREDSALIERLRERTTAPDHRDRLGWLAGNLRFALLLDETGRRMEPAYRLRERQVRGEVTGEVLARDAKAAREEMSRAPIEELFRAYSRRVRSRGELGVLSSLNQKLWTEYRDLERFLAGLDG